MGIEQHFSPHGFTELDKKLSWAQRGGKGVHCPKKWRERGDIVKGGAHQRRGGRGAYAGEGHESKTPSITAGEQREGVIARGAEERQRTENERPLAQLGLEADFLKHDMGAPDSLQCLSGAHRTAHSSCPVNHRTAHRKKDLKRAAAGAPDSAQCSVRCTPDCPVSPDRGKF
jgi:hypothetical protein